MCRHEPLSLTIYSALSLMFVLPGCSSARQDEQRPAAQTALPATGLILQESEGERRQRRPRPGAGKTLGDFIIKVDERGGGSTDFFMGYESIPPGAGIPPHHHPHSGEILFVQRGYGLASLGSRQGAVGPGATIYIPRDTRVSLRNTGSEPLTIAFLFPGPGIGEYLRAMSVREGERAEPLSPGQLGEIRGQHEEEITFDSLAGASGAGLILAASEGEHRVQRRPPSGVGDLATPFIIKVDRKNGKSPDLVMVYRDIEPGQAIAAHQHPMCDEIIFVHRGIGLASLGSREASVTAGATIYIPSNTPVTLRNTGTKPLTTLAIFAKSGFEEYLREVSVPQGKPAPPLSVEELSAIRARHRAHVVYDKP